MTLGKIFKNNGHNSTKRLDDGSRIAVMGGGPAGSFFSYFLLDLAERIGVDLKVDIYEPRDFSLPAPQGCNMCAGVLSETLAQNLATEGINLPASVVQNAISSYVLHTDVGHQRLDAAFHEKRIAAMFRGGGPRGIREIDEFSFDAHLLSLAEKKGANVYHLRVDDVERVADRLLVKTRNTKDQAYDLLAVATGVNTTALKLFEQSDIQYTPPKTIKTAIREYCLGKDIIDQYLGDSLHVFLLDIQNLIAAMIIPKGDYASVCIIGRDIDNNVLQTFLTAPEVKRCFPEGWNWEQPDCQCRPRINVRAAIRPYSDQIVFIGDCGVSRLYKDGIGAAYRSAKAAAACAVLEGISAEDFQRFYAPFCRTVELDNHFGRLIFFLTHFIQRVRFSRESVLRMVAAEQQSDGKHLRMSSVLWDTFTGSTSYQDVFLRTLNPALISRFIWGMVEAIYDG